MLKLLTKNLIPILGGSCAIAGILVGALALAPTDDYELDITDMAVDDARAVPQVSNLETIPPMESVLEKHLFVAERKPTGENSFPNLLVKGVYCGDSANVVLSLRSKPEVNVRIWKGEENELIENVTDSRDPRKPIVDFLGEWEIEAITFSGMRVKHLITGEVQTYEVAYTPAKKVKDNASAGYGQGLLATASSGGGANKSTKSGGGNSSGQVSSQFRGMLQGMSHDQRMQMMMRMRGGGGGGGNRDGSGQRNSNAQNSNKKSSNNNSSKKSSSKNSSKKSSKK